jgi:8-oxo-dGTP pyrophosphatase MutT (NUDIX family)
MSISRLFIGSASESLNVAEAVQFNLSSICEPRIWNQDLLSPGETVLQNLLAIAPSFDFAILISTGEDDVSSRDSKASAPRDNIIFEAGLFSAVLGPSRVFLLIESDKEIKMPTDLSGVTLGKFRHPSDDNYAAATLPALAGVKRRISELGIRSKLNQSPQPVDSMRPEVFTTRRDAWSRIQADCKSARSIAVLANRGVIFFGTDDSIISLAELEGYELLQKLRLVLLSDQSRWLTEGYILQRRYESLELFKSELEATHLIVESAMRRLPLRVSRSKSGVRYHSGEPQFRMLLTEAACYISSYAEPSGTQARDLPVYRFSNIPGSLYGAFKRHFDDIWHNHSIPGVYETEFVDPVVSAGGIVFCREDKTTFIALLQRDDGYWVLPKGQKMRGENSIEETALREVCEETGLRQSDLKILDHVGYYSNDTDLANMGITKVVHLFLMQHLARERVPMTAVDHSRAVWWPITNELPRIKHKSQEAYIRQALEGLRT